MQTLQPTAIISNSSCSDLGLVMPISFPKEIVVALMRFEENETRAIFHRVSGTKRSKS